LHRNPRNISVAAASDIILSEVHKTAFMAATLRAGHYLHADEPKIFEDSFAHLLLEMTEEEIRAYNARIPGPLLSTCPLRSRFAEDRLAAARDRVTQYVILGAGLDSYALRKGDELGSMIVFEVDDPPFQAWKRKRIADIGLTTPEQVRYVPCDFETMSLEEALAAQGFDPDQPTFVTWLGVTQYLTLDAIRETLRWAGSLAAGSELAVTIVEPEGRPAPSSAPRNIIDYTSYISMEDMTRMLHDAGFSRVEPLTREAADEFFKGRTDGLATPRFNRARAAIV
jgi:methyltransferase (TIGR00027 family)